MLDAALTYAALGWPVAPAIPRFAAVTAQATTNHSAIERWWTRNPNAGIVLATGGPVDVLNVPARVGRAALDRLRCTGLAVGPVAVTRGRCYFLVAGRDRDRFLTHHEQLGAPQLDIHYHGADDGILLPPSSDGTNSVYWELDPAASILACGHRLPTAAELHGTIAYVALQIALPV